MSTRSILAAPVRGRFQYIYCHYDGYPSGVGTILQEFYESRGLVLSLLALGDISTLGAGVDCGTRAYHRDCGEGLVLRHATDLDCLVASGFDQLGADYIYLFRGRWRVLGYGSRDTRKWRTIRQALVEERR